MSNGFKGTLGRTRAESTPWWPERTHAPVGAPNIVIIYMDDMGWSDPGCYGSEIRTPNIDAVAARGLRFNHYTTHPLCSPARAALLTGMNAHAVGSGWLSTNNMGYPGYTGEIPLDAPTLAEALRTTGYETIMTGKWHNTPIPDSVPAGPKHNWPSQRGFDTFYGFMAGETHYFFPTRLMLNNQVLPIDEYPRDYYATDDWTGKAIEYLKDLRASSPTKPFFLYVANNAMHAPMQAKERDIEKYRGCYDAGWTATREARFRRQIELGLIPPDAKLPPSDDGVPHWDATDPADRPLFARHMEVYAAMLDCADQNVGRLVDHLQAIGELDNTIIIFSSDNGGTDSGGATGYFNNNRRLSGLPPEPVEADRARIHDVGGPRSIPLYPAGWGEVSNTPFPSFKSYTGAGGRRVPFVLSWPAKVVGQGQIRQQFIHVTDVMPTLLELAGIAPPETIRGQPALRMHGKSFAPVLFDPTAAATRTEQYYECWSNRAFLRDGWLARSVQKRGAPIDFDNWTLHNLAEDFTECVDVGGRFPDKLTELSTAFDTAAREYFVYPLDNRTQIEIVSDVPPAMRGRKPKPRVFLPASPSVHRADILPLISNRSFRISTRFALRSTDSGVLWAVGDTIGGMVMYAEEGQLRFHYNGFGKRAGFAGVPLAEGDHEAVLVYEALGGRRGRGRLLLDDVEKAGWTDLSPTLMFGIFEGLDVGLDRRAPVLWDLYERHGAFGFSGSIREVLVTPA